jgi:hypothetical protein
LYRCLLLLKEWKNGVHEKANFSLKIGEIKKEQIPKPKKLIFSYVNPVPI